jgi:hypothetical protein
MGVTTVNPKKGVLPEAFADLEPFVATWALATMAARHRKRTYSSAEERKAFYDAMAPRLREVAEYLGRFPLHALPEDAAVLMRLALSLAEVSLTQEVYDAKVEAVHAHSSKLVRIGREMDGL